MKKRILCYGDSNTWGYISGIKQRREEEHRWTGICQNILGSGYILLEDGLNGRTTIYNDPTTPYRNGLSTLGCSLSAQKPLDLVVVMLGTNDFKFTDVYGAAAGVEQIVGNLMNADYIYRESSAIYRDGPKVLLMAPIPIDASVFPEGEAIGRFCEGSCKLSGLCAGIAKAHGCYFLDAGQYGKPSPVDGIHMDDESHLRLGQAVAEKIKEILG